MSILTLYWHLIALKHIFCLKIFALKFDVISEQREDLKIVELTENRYWFFKITKFYCKSNLLENKATVNLSVADTYRFNWRYPSLTLSVIRIIKFYAILSFLFVLMICLNIPPWFKQSG